MKKQSGSALTFIIIVIVVLLLIGGVVIVGGLTLFKGVLKNSKLLSESPIASKLTSAVLETQCDNEDKNICKYMANAFNMKEYSIKMTTTSEGITSENLMEAAGEDKTHIVSWENGKENYNTITIGNVTYTKDYSDNKWFKQIIKPNDTEKKIETDVKEEFLKPETVDNKSSVDNTVYKLITKEPCGKLTCFKYQIIDPSNTTVQYIWFDNKQYLTRKMRMEDNGSVTTGEYSYDNILISEPSPVKELKEGEIPLPGGGVYSQNDQQKFQQELEKYQKEMEQQYKNEQDNTNNGSSGGLNSDDPNNEDVFDDTQSEYPSGDN